MQNILDQIMPYLAPSERTVYSRLRRLTHAEGKPRCTMRYDDFTHGAQISVFPFKRVLKKLVQLHHLSLFAVQCVTESLWSLKLL